ncbi:hypothetical protein LTR37_008150 [Vermiconidia calcicola]|uniref:Uncharacterized protein n=1 Tax=Vermiconidia calcicola TaxID=1690605 RepID=A0ACC3NE72_9PEZI|nr:hypothetical protein LTR37_008150 [Vermiconidia calcicola]
MADLNRSASFNQASSSFRRHNPDLSIPRFTVSKTQNAYEYADDFKKNHVPPWLYNLTETWKELLEEPFKGVTNDGNVREGLFELQDMGIDIDGVCTATTKVLDQCTPDQKQNLQYPINAREWRAWSNPEFLLRPFGLRLEDLPSDLATSILGVLEASFSPEGYQKALAAMRINHFLGEICDVTKIMNQYSYNFLLFGSPSPEKDKPWGWLLYGHHLCLAVFFKGRHMTISPTFTGAEPNIIDAGPWSGTEILHTEGNLGLKLMQSLPQNQKDRAQIFKLMRDPDMQQTGDLKTDRWTQDDQRHLCGAFRDNRVVPYEGVTVSSLEPHQQDLILDIVEQFTLYLPQQARQMRKEQIRRHFDETYFCWIGGYGDDDAFYYRIQSPVIVCEFDHHSGVFLTNKEPAKFHTHTILRTPNAGDYGNAVRAEGEKVR